MHLEGEQTAEGQAEVAGSADDEHEETDDS